VLSIKLGQKLINGEDIVSRDVKGWSNYG